MPIRRTAGKDIVDAGKSTPRTRRKSEAATRGNGSAAQGAPASRTESDNIGQSIAYAATDLKPSAAEIERLAYSFWEARGRQGGSPEADWFRAEQELRKRAAVAATGA
jgi:Protein of unknown function (DUF2934)